MKKLYLTGYEKETIEQFLNKLNKEQIATVIDIREKPLSRKNGFSRNLLKKLLEKQGINYIHFQNLGSPEALRNQLRKDSNYLSFFKNYRKYIHNQPDLIKKVLKTIYSNGLSVLLCYEKEYEHCHRSIVASELIKCDSNLQVIPM